MAVPPTHTRFTEPQPSTSRVAKLREEYFTYRPAICLERALAYTRSYQETEGTATVVRRALALKRACVEKSITIKDGELLVGMPAFQPRGAVFCPEIAWRWLERELDTISTREQDPYLIIEKQKELLRQEIFPYWRGRSLEEYYMANLPPDTRPVAVQTGIIDVELKSQNGAGEFSPGYGNILLKKGLAGIPQVAKERLAQLNPAHPDSYDKIRFLEAVQIVCDAAELLAQRYAQEAERLAGLATDPKRAQELREIAKICRWVPMKPPRTFQEALQATWFCQVLLFLEENAPSYSPGRMDQYLYPFYLADLENGRLTPEGAQELIECFWLKTAEMTWLLNENSSKYFAGYMPFQNVTVGGQTPDGRDASNELSYMMVQASMNLRLFQPSLSVRLHRGTPADFLKQVCKLIRLGIGMPAIHNDAMAIKMMLNKGVSPEDAIDYCLVGCVEPNIHGKMSQWSDGGHYNFAAAVQLALDNGKSWLEGGQLGAPTGLTSSLTTFDDFKEAVKEQLHFFFQHIAIANLVAQKGHALLLPKPFSSSLIEGCVEKATDITEGGAVYNAGPAFIGTGIADLADSLAAVKKLVYDTQAISLEELVEVLKGDFAGREDLRQMLITRAPKYGNDLEEVDGLAQEFANLAADLAGSYVGYVGCPIINGLYPVSSHVPHGKVVGALPSGRRAWVPLADGCSPFHGYDTNGPTAVIKSVSRIDHSRHTAGTLLNMKFSPDLLKDDKGLDNLAALIRAYFELGGYHVQFNVVRAATLRAAQKEPEKYRGLLVRVAGYSAYFTDLCHEIQDDIIGRTEHARW